jgi:hypothetical protein
MVEKANFGLGYPTLPHKQHAEGWGKDAMFVAESTMAQAADFMGDFTRAGRR